MYLKMYRNVQQTSMNLIVLNDTPKSKIRKLRFCLLVSTLSSIVRQPRLLTLRCLFSKTFLYIDIDPSPLISSVLLFIPKRETVRFRTNYFFAIF